MTTEPLPVRNPATIRRGDLYWLVTDEMRGTIPHPHVVVQEDVFNLSRIATVIVCALTTNLNRANEPGNVLLDDGEGYLPKRSVIVVSQVSSVDKARLVEFIGTLSAARVDAVLDGMRFLQATYFGAR